VKPEVFAKIKERSAVIHFVYDIGVMQDRYKTPFTAKTIMRIVDEWRGYDGKEVYFRKMSEIEHARRLKAYHATSYDREAGEMVGIGYRAFYNWRRWKGLPSKGVPGTKRRATVCGG